MLEIVQCAIMFDLVQVVERGASMTSIDLFIFSVYPLRRTAYLWEDWNHARTLEGVLSSLPEAEIRAGTTWHIGDTRKIDTSSAYFRFGMTGRSTVGAFEDGHFLDADVETAPYTHAFVDLATEVVGIARSSKLGLTTLEIASRLTSVLNRSGEARGLEAEFRIDPLHDPREFEERFAQAFAVRSLDVIFRRPNATYKNELLRDLQKHVALSEGDEGSVGVRAQGALNREVLLPLIREVAVLGDDATARIVEREGQTRVRKLNLRKQQQLTVDAERIESDEELREIMKTIREAYIRMGFTSE